MKIISLNHETENIEVFHITDEYKKWCAENADKYDEEDPENNTDFYSYSECFNDFVTDLFRRLGYDNPECKTFMRVADDTPVNLVEIYPDEHIIDILRN